MKYFSKLVFSSRSWPTMLLRFNSQKQDPRVPRYDPTVEKSPQLLDLAPDMLDRGICVKDHSDPQQCYREPRVVIVGAGMAGLSAAARLTQRGIDNLVVLEASERPGGRIHSTWIGDVIGELGAHWRPDRSSAHPVQLQGSFEDPPRPGVPGQPHARGLFDRCVPGKTEIPTSISAYNKFRQIEQEADAIYCLGGNKQHGSLYNFISHRIQQELHGFPEFQQHDAARIMFGLAHMVTARGTDDTAMLRTDHDGCFMNIPGGDVRVPLGLIGTLAPILREIPGGCINYCKLVSCIYWGTSQKSGYRALVVTSGGEEYPADYVIVTVSLGVLCKDHVRLFCPALPSAKIDAMRCLGFGYANKIYVEYCRPFWFWHNGELNFKFGCGSPCHCLHGWTRGLISIEVAPNSKHVLCAWVVGPEACQMESLCDRDVAEGITNLLRIMTGNGCIPYPVKVMRSMWTSDPLYLGAYSYDYRSTGGSAQRDLACPLPGPSDAVPPILLFAGEATVPGHYATVAGARLSGVREAERIVQLTIRYKGPPLPASEAPKAEECTEN